MSSLTIDDTTTMGAPPYTPFDGGRYRMTMGLQALKPEDWIEIGPDRKEQLAERRRLLRERRDEVFAVLPEAKEACAELLELLVAFLPRRFPELYRRTGRQLDSLTTGDSWQVSPPEAHPLLVAGHLV